MSRERKSYDKKFKLISVELSKKRFNLVVLAKVLDITPALLYRWRKEYLSKKVSRFSENDNVVLHEMEQELVCLKKKFDKIEIERDILKKAVSIFSQKY